MKTIEEQKEWMKQFKAECDQEEKLIKKHQPNLIEQMVMGRAGRKFVNGKWI